jgi:hypothetical protein
MNNDVSQLSGVSDPLDGLLRDANEYLPDNGFTARVLQKLPPRRTCRWSRLAVLSAALLIGMALIAWRSPEILAVISGTWKQPSFLTWQTVLVFAPLMAALASLVWALVTVASGED